MVLAISKAMRLIYLASSVRNRLINTFVRFLTGKHITVDWRGFRIYHPEGVTIGSDFAAGKGMWLESVHGKGKLTIGDRVNLSDNVHIGCYDKVTICDGVLIGSNVLITDHSHGAINAEKGFDARTPPNQRPIYSKGPVWIGENVWIGDGVCILASVKIGSGAIIGANSVITRDVPANTIWVGIPARQITPGA